MKNRCVRAVKNLHYRIDVDEYLTKLSLTLQKKGVLIFIHVIWKILKITSRPFKGAQFFVEIMVDDAYVNEA